MRKQDIKLITSFIDNKNPKQELNFALVRNGAIFATDTRKAIQFNHQEVRGNALMHKKLLQGLSTILGKDERLFFENGYFYTDNVKFNIDTSYYVEDENGKNKIGAKADCYPDINTIINKQLPYHFTLENINNLQWELTQKNCFIADIHLNPVIAYNDCSLFDIYYEPQKRGKNDFIETATVKIVAQKSDDNGVVYTQFIAVFMGTVFESKAKEEI